MFDILDNIFVLKSSDIIIFDKPNVTWFKAD